MHLGESEETTPCKKPAVMWLVLTRRSVGGICAECDDAAITMRTRSITYEDAIAWQVMNA